MAVSATLRMRRGVLAALILAVAACDGKVADNLDPGVFGDFAGLVRRAPEGEDARDVMTAARLDAAGVPVLLAVVRSVDQGNTLIPLAANLGTVQWTDAAGGGLLTRDGLLVGTRGLGNDLLTAEVGAVRAALRAGGRRGVPRVETRLRPDNVTIRQRYVCDVVPVGRETLEHYGLSFATTVYEERCDGDRVGTPNRYWVDAGGAVRRQEVRVSKRAGILEISLLRG